MFQTGMALFLLRNTKEMFSIIFQGLLFRKMKSMGTKRNNKCTIKIIHWNLSTFTDNFPFWQLFALYQNWVKQSVMKDAQNNVIRIIDGKPDPLCSHSVFECGYEWLQYIITSFWSPTPFTFLYGKHHLLVIQAWNKINDDGIYIFLDELSL